MSGRNKYDPWGLGRRGAAPNPSAGPRGKQTSDYAQIPATYEGGAVAYSGDTGRSPNGAEVLQRQYGPIDLRDNRTEAEAIQIPTPNVQWGQLMISIETEWEFGALGGYNFDILSPVATIYAWNSGVRQAVKRRALNTGSGPMRWVWPVGSQFDQLTVGVLPFFVGLEPQIQGLLLYSQITKMNFTAVWRYLTSTPRNLEINQTFRDG